MAPHISCEIRQVKERKKNSLSLSKKIKNKKSQINLELKNTLGSGPTKLTHFFFYYWKFTETSGWIMSSIDSTRTTKTKTFAMHNSILLFKSILISYYHTILKRKLSVFIWTIAKLILNEMKFAKFIWVKIDFELKWWDLY